MSPFSVALRTLRAQLALGQGEFARRVGYRQTYISALECGTKLPKDEDLVRRIVVSLNLTNDDENTLWRAYTISQREIVPPRGSPPAAYRIYAQIKEILPTLSYAQMHELSAMLESIRAGCSVGSQHPRHGREVEKETPM